MLKLKIKTYKFIFYIFKRHDFLFISYFFFKKKNKQAKHCLFSLEFNH